MKYLYDASGVIDSDKPHDLSKIQPISQFFIDTGATSEKDSPVNPGDLGVFDREFSDLGQRVVSKALDNRASCALVIETIKQLASSPHELNFVFSVQEEVQSRGAMTAAYGLDLDLGIAVDVTPVGNIAGMKMQVNLGDGPAIKIRDVGFIADPSVVDWMIATAKKARIPHQLEVLTIGSTDARVMQISRAGMLSGVLSIPCRYVHSPSEMIDMKDYENALNLLVALLSNPFPERK